MVGGYLTFSGVDAKGKWQDTAVQEVLPVQVLATDDRMEHCEGVRPVSVKEHAILEGLEKTWPRVLGYNKTILKPEASLWENTARVDLPFSPQTVLLTGHHLSSVSGRIITACSKILHVG